MSAEPESLMLQLLRDMRAEIAEIRRKMATDDDISPLRTQMATKEDTSELKSGIADVASDLITNRRQVGEQIVGLRRAVVEYHTSVIGHGVLISELEQHLNLTPDAH